MEVKDVNVEAFEYRWTLEPKINLQRTLAEAVTLQAKKVLLIIS